MSPKFGLILSNGAALSPSQAVKDGVLGEKSGFDSVWIPDHITDYDGGARVDCWTVLAGIGVQTQKVLLSPAVTDVHIVHPAKAAQIIASLDELTGGRTMVALGAGEAMSIVPFGIEFEKAKARAKRVREYIDVLKLLWTATRERRASYQGDFYNLKEAFIIQQPTRKPHPPIYIGAIESNTLLKMTGEIADGWLPWMTTPEMFGDGVKIIRDAASGRQKIGSSRYGGLDIHVHLERQEGSSQRQTQERLACTYRRSFCAGLDTRKRTYLTTRTCWLTNRFSLGTRWWRQRKMCPRTLSTSLAS